MGIRKFFCFICTNATFNTNTIQEEISKIKKDILLVVDEAHNFGATNLSNKLDDRFKYRLALSATIDRHGDEEGTQKLKDYFGEKCIEYSLDRAIKEKFLTPYKYFPVPVYLTESELERYSFLTREIGKSIIQDKYGNKKLNDYGEQQIRKRARLVAGAINKIGLLKSLIKDYINDNHILVYSGATTVEDYDVEEDLRQIDIITDVLGNELNMKVSQFTSKEDNCEREVLKREFGEGESIQVLIAIRCLDEGVNIPEIKTAFILASSTNPKEYVQRRGRVLRKAKGKDMAVIYDFITLPRKLDEVKHLMVEETNKDKTLVLKELNRMVEFRDASLNPLSSDTLINEIKDAYNLWSEGE